jgi:hypothetical protein
MLNNTMQNGVSHQNTTYDGTDKNSILKFHLDQRCPKGTIIINMHKLTS